MRICLRARLLLHVRNVQRSREFIGGNDEVHLHAAVDIAQRDFGQVGGHDLVVQSVQHLGHGIARGQVRLDEQDRFLPACRGSRLRDLRSSRLCTREVQAHDGAQALGAFDFDQTLDMVHEVLDHGQAQARALPSGLVVKNMSKMRALISSLMPMPLSATLTMT